MAVVDLPCFDNVLELKRGELISKMFEKRKIYTRVVFSLLNVWSLFCYGRIRRFAGFITDE